MVTVTIKSLLVASAAASGDDDAPKPKQRGVPIICRVPRSPPADPTQAAQGGQPRSPEPTKLAYSGMGNTFLKLTKMH